MANTVKQFAMDQQMSQNTVLDLIHSGELIAYNVSRKVGGKPQWRISDEEKTAFIERRRSTPANAVKPRRRSRKTDDVIEFIKN